MEDKGAIRELLRANDWAAPHTTDLRINIPPGMTEADGVVLVDAVRTLRDYVGLRAIQGGSLNNYERTRQMMM